MKQPKRSSIDKKRCGTMGYYLAIKKKDILLFVTAWMDLEVIQRKTIPYDFTYM